MKKRVRRFDGGGMASSGVQSAFTQPSNSGNGIGLGNNALLVQISSSKDTGVGGVQTPQANGPLNIGQPVQQTQQPQQQMKKGGKVQKFCRGGGVEVRGKTRGKFV